MGKPGPDARIPYALIQSSMSTVRLPSGKQFQAGDSESLLDAALRQGVALAYSCKTGRCNTCKARIARGATKPLRDEIGLSTAERDAGWVLTCARAAQDDIDLQVDDLGDIQLFPAKTNPCRIQALERPAPTVLKVTLRLPPAAELRFHAGQYIDVIGHGGLRRSYSIANAPREDRLIELHIREVPGGAMSEYWFKNAKEGDLLRLHGPLGTFFLGDVENKDLVFLATGTGIAPVKAMLEGLATLKSQPRSVTIYWGNRHDSDFYWHPAALPPGHRFVPVLSSPNDGWQGARGHVQQVLAAQAPCLDNAVVYACGSEAMIDGARRALLQAGLAERQFYADAFVCSAPT